MPDPLFTVTRQQLAEFIKDPRTIRAFEKAVVGANVLLPADVVTLTRLAEEASNIGSYAASRAQEALDSLDRIAGEIFSTLASIEPSMRSQIEDVFIRARDVESNESALESKAQLAHDLSLSAERRSRSNLVLSWLTI